MSDKTYKVTIEGQSLDLPAEIAGDDEKLRAALQPFFPGAANAKFMRSEADGVETVNVVKQAGTKGRITLDVENKPVVGLDVASGGDKTVIVLARLVQAPESRNPVIDLYYELRDVDPRILSTEQVLEITGKINQVIEDGQQQEEMMSRAEERLKDARAVPSTETPAGF